MAEEIKTFCRICEPLCGLVATVEDGRIERIRANPDHVHSQGHLCIKASAAVDVAYDPDRVLKPLKRVGALGEFEEVSWDEALDDIAKQLTAIRKQHGNDSFAIAQGNPTAFSYATAFFLAGFQKALGVRWRYAPNADDTGARHVANYMNFGSVLKLPLPDIWRSDFALIIGANPKIAHTSTLSEPRMMDALRGLVEKGGRVVVVDPRRSETAKEFEHVPIMAGKDPFLLIGMIKTILDEHIYDADFVAQYTRGLPELRELVSGFSAEQCATEAGLAVETVQRLARDFAGASSACIYSRTGTCTQLFGTLTNMLLDFLSILTGNLEQRGGNVFGWAPIDFGELAEQSGWTSFNENPTRVHGIPEVYGIHPTTSFPPDTLVPGEGQVRALMTVASNMASSSPIAGAPAEEALSALAFHFSLDFYVNETNKFADYILPVPTFYEREDFPIIILAEMLRPSLYATPAVVDRVGECREEWEIMNEICRRMGVGGAYASPIMRLMAKLGLRITPRQMFDLLLRTSKSGDKFGLRPSGLSAKKLLAKPDGVNFKTELPLGDLKDILRTKDGRVDLASSAIRSELKRLSVDRVDVRYPFVMFGRREMKSINSWMHNARRVMPEGRMVHAMINPADAHELKITTGDEVEISSAKGAIRMVVKISDDVGIGQVSVPHGWGHSGGWKIANSVDASNSNLLASSDVEDLEALAGMSVFNGIPVNIRATKPDMVGARSIN